LRIAIGQGYAFRMASIAAPIHRLSVEDVYRMVEAGVLEENERVELVEGVLVDMVPISAEHDGALAWLNRYFARVDAQEWEVRIRSMLLIAGGFLLPDLSLVARMPRSTLPATAHLVIEVAQTSHARDREKASDYAAAGVPEYWIVDLPGRTVHVHRHRWTAPTSSTRPSPTAPRSSRCSPTRPRSTSAHCSADAASARLHAQDAARIRRGTRPRCRAPGTSRVPCGRD